MQFSGTKKPAVGIVYDSDFGAAIDDVLALALLHGLEGKQQARIAGLSISNPSLKAAQLCDLVEKFYASAITGQAAIFFSRAAIGLNANGRADGGVPVATALLEKKDETGKPVYTTRIRSVNETAIPEILIRNALTAQYDQNAAIVLAGPATDLARLLDLNGAPELIQSKVKFLVVAGYKDAAMGDLAAAKRVYSEWPTPIIAVGSEVGAALPFPASSIETDFGYAAAHPVAAAYRAAHTMPYDAPTTAMAAVLYAARPKEKYFQLSEPGKIVFGTGGKAEFRAGSGKDQYLIVDPERKEEVLKIFTTLASAKPVAPIRKLPAAVENVQVEEPVKKN